ncbi:MAG: hypothetical protein KAS58_00360, partial [Calditrichia bacterium]|nr:hypothetical protein [Calditrichia bacterium]
DLSWSPGNYILYQHSDEQNYQILDPQTGYERPLVVTNNSDSYMIHARSSPDGKNVVVPWVREEGQKLWLISLEDTSKTCLQDQNAADTWSPLLWSADGTWLYVVQIGRRKIKILNVPVNGDKPKIFAELPFESLYSKTGLGSDAITMTPDGSLIVCSVRESISDIWVLENFDPEVE